MRRALFVVIAVLLALLPATALAVEPRSGAQVDVGPDETIDDDLYVTGGTVTMRGTVQGDVVAAGGTISITGNVTGSLFAAGGTIVVSGPVGGDVRVAGGNVTVTAPVEGDLLSFGGMLTVAPSATVTRDVLVAAGSATIDGQVGRNVSAGTGGLTINGMVGGNVRSDGGELRLGDGAVVNGGISYASSQTASIAPGATVQGDVERRPATQFEATPVLSPVVGWLQAVVGLFLAGLLFALVFPRAIRRSVESIQTRPVESLGIGVALLIVVPIIAALVTIIGVFIGGWWVGVAILAAYVVAVALGIPISGMWLGDWVLHQVGQGGANLLWGLLVGVVILATLGLVPILGGIAVFAALVFGLGALAIAARGGPRAPAVTALRPGDQSPRDDVAA